MINILRRNHIVDTDLGNDGTYTRQSPSTNVSSASSIKFVLFSFAQPRGLFARTDEQTWCKVLFFCLEASSYVVILEKELFATKNLKQAQRAEGLTL